MSDATFTFRVEESLKESFADLARTRDLSAAQLLRALMRDAVAEEQQAAEYDAWFRREVEAALREADDPTVARIPHQVVQENWRRQREALSRRGR